MTCDTATPRHDIGLDDILAARVRLFGAGAPAQLRKTPLLKLDGASLGLACAEVWFKLEHLQLGGSFKARGMFNRLLSTQVPRAGVVIASGGNAGIACAAAARAVGAPCTVFVSSVSPMAKREKLAALGASVVVAGDHYPQALQACRERAAETGAMLVHAYDQVEVVAGAGTLALEIEEQAGLPDAVLVSVGGGGLIGGLAAGFASRTRVVALEPEACPTLYEARRQGHPVDVDVGGIAADSLGARRIGDIAWTVTQRHVDTALLVPDEAIREAQRWMWNELRLAVEPAAAVPLAALRCGACTPGPDARVCLIVCGANLDPASLN
ncbi:MAG: threonine/serine dehydratase [Rhodoferax sp.]|nr:threonine/serine dehydratase [Rhodoferax sp.]MCB2041694.1 threonine/serine dehydratase [Rhodoferax sp.]MCP5262028.1 threonine/serine dehydratase [Rhodoferax sp.]MCW5629269.1 threonine/serine dehydratase [Rhodoferax sp.]